MPRLSGGRVRWRIRLTCSPDELNAWERVSCQAIEVHTFPGEHFLSKPAPHESSRPFGIHSIPFFNKLTSRPRRDVSGIQGVRCNRAA